MSYSCPVQEGQDLPGLYERTFDANYHSLFVSLLNAGSCFVHSGLMISVYQYGHSATNAAP